MHELLDYKCVEVNKRTSTEISTSGGDGFIHNGSGYIKPVETHSETKIVTEVWLAPETGIEQNEVFPLDLEIRAGHALTLLVVDSRILSIYNHTTQNEITLDSAMRDWGISRIGKRPQGSCAIQILGVVTAWIIAMIVGVEAVLWLLIGGFYIIYFMITRSRAKSYDSKLKELYDEFWEYRNELVSSEHFENRRQPETVTSPPPLPENLKEEFYTDFEVPSELFKKLGYDPDRIEHVMLVFVQSLSQQRLKSLSRLKNNTLELLRPMYVALDKEDAEVKFNQDFRSALLFADRETLGIALTSYELDEFFLPTVCLVCVVQPTFLNNASLNELGLSVPVNLSRKVLNKVIASKAPGDKYIHFLEIWKIVFNEFLASEAKLKESGQAAIIEFFEETTERVSEGILSPEDAVTELTPAQLKLLKESINTPEMKALAQQAIKDMGSA